MGHRSLFVFLIVAAAFLLPAAVFADGERGASGLGRPPAPGTFFLYTERIAFQDGGRVDAERGVLYVPLRRDQPAAGVVGLEIYRFPAADGADPATPPVFVLHGGPGWPGLEGSLERSDYYASRIEPLARLADVVVVGQRGIGSSKPDTACKPPPTPPPVDVPVSPEQREAVVRETSERCKAFWEGHGLDLSGFTVVEAAADVDDVRATLGYDRITLWGGSFGSHWSMAVMRFHPRIVARAVLTGLEGPDHTYDMPGDVLKALERMAAAAEASDTLSPHLPEGGLLAAFRQVIARVDAEPVVVTVAGEDGEEPRKVHVGADEIRGMAMGVTGSARSRRGLPRWPAELLELHRGDYARAAEEIIDDDDSRFPTASFFMLDCGSGISRGRLVRLENDPAVATVGPIGWFYQAACPVWESDLGEDFRQNFTTEIPAVLVHGNWDTSTPFENALELAPHFTNGKLVVVKGGTHGALREALEASESFRDALMRFVASGDASALPDEVELPPIEWEVPKPEDAETRDD